jgi:hypothetical protein
MSRKTVFLVVLYLAGSLFPLTAQPPQSGHDSAPYSVTQVLGRPTDHSITLNLLSKEKGDAWVEFGTNSNSYSEQTAIQPLKPGIPLEIELSGLKSDTQYYYHLNIRPQGMQGVNVGEEATFHTQRPPGGTYTFAIQGDSHPERLWKMFDPALYEQTLQNVAKEQPDFYITMGDDFSIEKLIERNDLNQTSVNEVYAGQRPFLGIVGRSSPLFLVNGNHEQAALANLDGTATNPAILAGRARSAYFSLPALDEFYTGDAGKIDQVGLPRDYYSWTWGDALFVVIDFYWHSKVTVDNKPGTRGHDRGGNEDHGKKREQAIGLSGAVSSTNVITSVDALGELVPPKQQKDTAGKGGKDRDFWGVTLGEEQYRWLTKTLSESHAKWKFVFCHHVLGTGRGGVERASLYEWGGKEQNGEDLFTQKRPGWDLPIHQLMAKYGVTIFFQGHDHIFAHQELDGVVYQSCPNPADPTRTAFNREAYRSGHILPGSGHIKVTVSSKQVDVDYIKTWLSADLAAGHTNGEVGFHYSIPSANPAKP